MVVKINMDYIENFMEKVSLITDETIFLKQCPTYLNEFQKDIYNWKKIADSYIKNMPDNIALNTSHFDVSFWLSMSHERLPIAGGSLEDKYTNKISLDYNILGTQSVDYSCASFFHYNSNATPKIATSVFSQVLMVIEGECHYTEHELSQTIPEKITNSTILETLKIVSSEKKIGRRGDIIVRDRRSSIKMIDTNIKCVLLSVTPISYSALFQLSFDEKTGHISQIIDNTIGESRKRKLLDIIQRHGNKNSIKVLRKLLDDNHHGVRWQTLKSLMNLDEDNIQKYLKIGIKDEHDEISNACQQFLNELDIAKAG